MSADQHPRVVVIGGGFAGLAATQTLKRADVDVTLVDRRNFHLFQPLLYQVATGELSPSNIASPLRGILRRQPNVTVLLGDVQQIDLEKRQVELEDQQLEFDYLVVATGSTHHYFGNDEWSKLAPGLKTVEDATEIRRQILSAFEAAEASDDPEEIRELLTFVIVGAGPTGCELAGALAEVAFHAMKREFRRIDPGATRILMVEPSDFPLHFYPEPLPQRTAQDLEGLGVELLSGYRLEEIQPTCVVLKPTRDPDGDSKAIPTRTVIWAAGVKGSPLGAMINDQLNSDGKGGRIRVNQDTSLPSHPNVFVCGDLAIFEQPKKGELPCLAPVATQMGTHAAKCIIADIRGRKRKPFRYFDRGSLAVIGRYRAVGTIGKLKLKGIIAWALWLFIHLMFITRFRNRILVLVQWGWTYFTHDRSSRLITESPKTLPPKTRRAGDETAH